MIHLLKKEIFYIVFSVLFCVAIAVLIYPSFSSMGTDGIFYALLGKNIAEGNGFTLFGGPHLVFSPLLPIFIAAFYRVFSDLEFAAHASVIFFAAASLPLVYICAKAITNTRKTAVVALIFFAANGYFIWNYSTTVTPQILAGFFSIITCTLLVIAFRMENDFLMKKNRPILFFIGVSAGLSYLSRPEYFFSIIPISAFILFFYRKLNFPLKRIFFGIAIVVFGFFLVAYPYLWFLHHHLGEWTISGRMSELSLFVTGTHYENIDNSANGLGTAIITPPQIENSFIQMIVRDIGSVSKKFFEGLLQTEQSVMRIFGIVGIMLFAYGIREFVLSKQFKELAVAMVSFFPIIFVALGQGGAPHYLIQFFYLFSIFMAIGFWAIIHDIVAKFQPSRLWKNMLIFCLSLLSIAYLFLLVPQLYIFLPSDYVPHEFKIMGTWAKENISGIENEVLLARKPDVSFYAGAKFALVPNVETHGALIGIMRSNDIHYLVADDRYFKDSRPQFAYLLDEKNATADFTLVKSVVFNNKKVFLYRLNSL